MIKSNWNYPTTIWVGNGRIKELFLACKNIGINKPLFVTDMDLSKTDMVRNIIEENNSNSIPTKIFSNFKGNPVGNNVAEGVEIFKKYLSNISYFTV